MNISLFDFPSGYNNNDYWDTIDKNRIRKRIYFVTIFSVFFSLFSVFSPLFFYYKYRFFFKKLTLKLLNNLPTQKINNHFTIIINRMSNLLTSLMIRLKSVWNYSFASVAAIYGNNYPFMVLRKVIAEISRKH